MLIFIILCKFMTNFSLKLEKYYISKYSTNELININKPIIA